MTPLVQTVKRWWFEADARRDPQAQREFLARIDGVTFCRGVPTRTAAASQARRLGLASPAQI